MKFSRLTEMECEQDDTIVVRLFINGQYMATERLICIAFRDPTTNDVVLDADFEVFSMEKK